MSDAPTGVPAHRLSASALSKRDRGSETTLGFLCTLGSARRGVPTCEAAMRADELCLPATFACLSSFLRLGRDSPLSKPKSAERTRTPLAPIL
jgi:hypothetical protein